MRVVFPREVHSDENRICLFPVSAKKLVDMGWEVIIEQGLGENCKFKDSEYEQVGVKVKTKTDLYNDAQVVCRIRKPSDEQIKELPENVIHLSYLDPFNEKQLMDQLNQKNITAISLEMIPRTTLAQKMDFLSSQASLAGYAAVTIAAERLDKVFPMMTTPAGTISPSRVFIIGAGVAGLQAIATAKRMGARVEAFDTRAVVEEQVQSLVAKFVKVDLGETGQTKDGYAKALTEDQLKKQQEVMAKHCALADVVITTAQVFGRKAPLIVNKQMVADMKPGSLLVDLAVETGGNVEGSKPGQEVDVNGVTIIGVNNLPGKVAVHASQMLSANMTNLLEEIWDKENKKLNLDFENEIIKGCVILQGGKIIHEKIMQVHS